MSVTDVRNVPLCVLPMAPPTEGSVVVEKCSSTVRSSQPSFACTLSAASISCAVTEDDSVIGGVGTTSITRYCLGMSVFFGVLRCRGGRNPPTLFPVSGVMGEVGCSV
jgi:hypothetical protein